jgi:hypothetical protein
MQIDNYFWPCVAGFCLTILIILLVNINTADRGLT